MRGFWRIGLLLLLIFSLAPFAAMLLTAVKDNGEIATHPLLPGRWVWGNLTGVWHSALPVYFRNTLIIAACATVLNLSVALPAAYALARLPVPGVSMWRMGLLVTQMFSPVVLVVSLYRIAASTGLTNSLAGLILVNAAYSLAFSVWMLSACLAAVPEEMEEAARIDGCGRLSAFRRVTLPAAAPGVVTTLIFVFIASWNEFVVAFTFLSSPELKPLTVGLFDFASAYAPQWPMLMAASMWAILPVGALFIAIEGRLAEGLTAGSVK